MKTICPKCGIEFENNTKRKFCSRHCANSHIQTKKQNINRSLKLKGKKNLKWTNKKYDLLHAKYNNNPNYCKICGNIIPFLEKQRKTCKKCRQFAWKGTGGYRENSGHSKSGYYKGIYCGSTYELVYVIYRLDHNLSVKRFTGILKSKDLTYIPDFIEEDNVIIEIKGYHTDLVDAKKKLAEDLGYKVYIKYKDDLKKEFEWVKNNYIYNSLEELYDNYKPKYNYICDWCKKPFYRFYKYRTKTGKYFCSVRCAAKGRSLHNKKLPSSKG